MITIKGKEYKFKFTLRAMMIFEQITKRTFSINSITDEYLYLYCLLIANNPQESLTFDDLIDAMDEDITIMEQFKQALETHSKQNSLFSNTEDGDVKKNL